MATCDSTGLKMVYGDVTTCKSLGAQSCALPPIPMTNGMVDAAGCVAAYMSTCDSYFETLAHSNPACLPAPGSIEDLSDTGCGYDAQCMAGDVCDSFFANDDTP